MDEREELLKKINENGNVSNSLGFEEGSYRANKNLNVALSNPQMQINNNSEVNIVNNDTTLRQPTIPLNNNVNTPSANTVNNSPTPINNVIEQPINIEKSLNIQTQVKEEMPINNVYLQNNNVNDSQPNNTRYVASYQSNPNQNKNKKFNLNVSKEIQLVFIVFIVLLIFVLLLPSTYNVTDKYLSPIWDWFKNLFSGLKK